MADPEVREELASIAASLRAYLEWQHDCGTSGIPRRPRGEAAPRPVAPRVEAPVEEHAYADAPPPMDDGPDEPPPELAAELAREVAPARRREPEPPREVLPPFVVRDPPPAAPVVARAAVTKAPVAPPVARALDVVQAEVSTCTKCGLASTRNKTVFSRGNPKAKLCIVGEAPGADEDEQGLPFVGRAGQLLDKMIGAMGLNPETDVYVCNIIKCRPPGNRKPEPEEIATCIPYLHEQLSQVDPRAIVAMGNTAVGAILGTTLGITKVRGAWKLYRGKIPVMPTYHPSYLLRPGPTQAEAKRQAWEDLQTVMKELGLSKPPRA